MSRPRVSLRVALACGLLFLVLVAAATSVAAALIEAHHQETDRHHRLLAAVAYVSHGAEQATTTKWQQQLTGKLHELGLGATLTLVGPPDGKRLLYNQPLVYARDVSKPPGSTRPTATFSLTAGAGRLLRLALFAAPYDGSRRLIVAFGSGLVALLAGGTLLLWATSRWLIAPLRRLSAQADAVAGGDSIETPAASPIREVDTVAVAISGMASRLAQTAEQDARLEAEQRLLVSSIAHDLRTPLFSLRGYLDAIATGIGNPRERLDRAREKAEQIDALLTTLFDYAITNIDQQPCLLRTDLAEALVETTTAFELAARERGVQIRVSGAPRTPALIDRAGFARAVGNVIDNALQHTPPGGAVDITHGQDTDGIFVHVVDDGSGIPPELLPHVFEPLVRADNDHAHGTGLGLAIARRLLANQGGTIRAANAPGRGASFTLRLPPTTLG